MRTARNRHASPSFATRAVRVGRSTLKCRRKSAAAAREAGFTLLELLVALTLLGLVLTVIFGELRFTTRAWDAADAKLDRNGELLSVHGFLRQRLQQVQEPQAAPADLAGAAVAVFQGSSRAMDFIGTMPANVSQGGFYDISLSTTVSSDTGEDLVIAWRPFDAEETRLVADSPDNSRVLLRGVSEVRFSYFGKTSDSVAPQWWDIWPVRDAVPSLIRLQIAFADDDPRSWPDLVVAPAIATTVQRLP